MASPAVVCPICLENRQIARMRFLRCGHGFCTGCTTNAFSHPTCPICRVPKGRSQPLQIFVNFATSPTLNPESDVETAPVSASTPALTTRQSTRLVPMDFEAPPPRLAINSDSPFGTRPTLDDSSDDEIPWAALGSNYELRNDDWDDALIQEVQRMSLREYDEAQERASSVGSRGRGWSPLRQVTRGRGGRGARGGTGNGSGRGGRGIGLGGGRGTGLGRGGSVFGSMNRTGRGGRLENGSNIIPGLLNGIGRDWGMGSRVSRGGARN